jgi:hypothetical protein
MNMKRVIKGKRYDTDKATLVGETMFGEPGEAGYTRQSLYRKRGGEYFARTQGPYTLDVIVPLTHKEAEEWVMDNKGMALYYEEFKGQGIKTINVSISLDVKRKLDIIANTMGLSRNKIIEDLIRVDYAKMFPGD